MPLINEGQSTLTIRFRPNVRRQRTRPKVHTKRGLTVRLRIRAYYVATTFILSMVGCLCVTSEMKRRVTRYLVMNFNERLMSLVVRLRPMIMANGRISTSLALSLPIRQNSNCSVSNENVSRLLRREYLVVGSYDRARHHILVTYQGSNRKST